MSEHHPSGEPIPSLERWLGPFMSCLGLVNLFLWAGLIHRAQQDPAHIFAFELKIMQWGLFGLWPFFVLEAMLAWSRRHTAVSGWLAFWRVLLVLAFPPFRLGWIHPVTNKIWLPFLGWHGPGKLLARRLDRVFNVPMFIIALLILPVLIIENYMPEQLNNQPMLALALHIGAALIWIAFSMEFIVKSAASPKSLIYLKERWLDLLIVVLPTLEFLLTRWVDASPLLRLLRLGRAMGPQQINKLTKLYRFRGVMMRGWQAFLLLQGVARLLGQTPEKQLKKLEERLEALEEERAELLQEIRQLREKIAPPATPLPAESGRAELP